MKIAQQYCVTTPQCHNRTGLLSVRAREHWFQLVCLPSSLPPPVNNTAPITISISKFYNTLLKTTVCTHARHDAMTSNRYL